MLIQVKKNSFLQLPETEILKRDLLYNIIEFCLLEKNRISVLRYDAESVTYGYVTSQELDSISTPKLKEEVINFLKSMRAINSISLDISDEIFLTSKFKFHNGCFYYNDYRGTPNFNETLKEELMLVIKNSYITKRSNLLKVNLIKSSSSNLN